MIQRVAAFVLGMMHHAQAPIDTLPDKVTRVYNAGRTVMRAVTFARFRRKY